MSLLDEHKGCTTYGEWSPFDPHDLFTLKQSLEAVTEPLVNLKSSRGMPQKIEWIIHTARDMEDPLFEYVPEHPELSATVGWKAWYWHDKEKPIVLGGKPKNRRGKWKYSHHIKPYGSPDSYKSLSDIPGWDENMKKNAAELGRLIQSEMRDSLEKTKRRMDNWKPTPQDSITNAAQADELMKDPRNHFSNCGSKIEQREWKPVYCGEIKRDCPPMYGESETLTGGPRDGGKKEALFKYLNRYCDTIGLLKWIRSGKLMAKHRDDDKARGKTMKGGGAI